MIKVVIKKREDEVPYFFEVSGHAGYADPGKDIVCAAISALTITFANSMEALTEDHVTIIENTKQNVITIDLPSIREGKASAELLVLAKSLYLGITQVNEEYEHKYISVKEEIQC